MNLTDRDFWLNSNVKLFKIFTWLFLFIPISYYIYTSILYSYNFPIGDDYGAILNSIRVFEDASTWQQKIELLLSQHNEHRIAIVRSLSIIDLKLFGQVHFDHLQWVGDIALLVVFYIFLRFFREEKKWPILYLLPISFLLFQTQSYQNQFWAMGSIQNFGIHALVLYFLFLCTKPVDFVKFLAGLFFALLCVFCSGNGILVIFIWLAILIYQKQWKYVGLVFLSGLILFFIYFHNYASPKSISLVETIQNLYPIIISCFSFIGSMIYHPKFYYVAIAAGASISLWYAYLFFIGYYKKNLFIFSYFSFMLITAIMMSVSRYQSLSAYSADAFGVSSHYKINSAILFILFYVSLVDVVHKKALVWIANLATCIFFIFSTVSYFPKINQMKEYRLSENWLYQHTKKVSAISWYEWGFAKNTIDNAVKKSQFIPPVLSKIDLTPQPIKINISENQLSRSVNCQIDTIIEENGNFIIRGWAIKNNESSNFSQIIFLCQNKKQQTYFKGMYHKRFDLVAKYKNSLYHDAGFMVVIPQAIFKDADKYGVIIQKNSSFALNWIDLKYQ